MNAADPPGRLRLQHRLVKGVNVVSLSGEIDLSTCHGLREQLLRIVAEDSFGGLVVDLDDVSFLDSTGLGVLVGIWRKVRATGHGMALLSPSLRAECILRTAHLTKILPVYGLQDQAVAAVTSRA